METFKFEASLKLGRTLDDLWAEEDEVFPFSLHGMKITMQETFGQALCEAFYEASNEMGGPMYQQLCQGQAALTRINASYDMRYRDPKEISEKVTQSFPTMNALLQMMLAGPVSEMPPNVKEAFKELDGKSEGIKGISIRGLPNKFEVVFDCKNFKVSSVLKKFIELASTEPADAA